MGETKALRSRPVGRRMRRNSHVRICPSSSPWRFLFLLLSLAPLLLSVVVVSFRVHSIPFTIPTGQYLR